MILKYGMVGAIVLALLVPLCAQAGARKVVDVPENALQIATVEQIDAAIAASVWEWPRHRMLRFPDERRHMAEMISDATIYTDVSPLLLVAVVKRESSFDENALGKLGEKGLTQMKGIAARGCDLSKPEGQLACSVNLLAQVHRRCGTWRGALTVYATRAGTCTSEHPTVQAAVNRRLNDWQKLSLVAMRSDSPMVADKEPALPRIVQSRTKDVAMVERRRVVLAGNVGPAWRSSTRFHGAAL
jgi:hypothetical protein